MSPTVDSALGPLQYGSRPIRGEAFRLPSSCRSTKPNARPIPRFPSPKTASAPPANIEEFVSFGQEEGDDSMSISALEREDWVGWEPDQMIRQPIRQLGAPRPPRGSHEGSVEGCPGVGAYLESSRRACQE